MLLFNLQCFHLISADVYMQLLDWSATGILAVALDKNIYIWDQFTGESEVQFLNNIFDF